MRVHQSNKLGFAVSFFVQLRREPDEIRKKEKGKIGGGGDQGQGKGQRLTFPFPFVHHQPLDIFLLARQWRRHHKRLADER